MKKLIVISIFLVILQAAAFGQAVSDRDKGIDLYRSGQFAEAIVVLEKLVADGTADLPTAHYLAAAYVQADRKEDAKELLGKLKKFKRAAGVSPDYETRAKMIDRTRPDYGDKAGTLNSGRIKLLVELKHDGKIGFVFPFETTSSLLENGAIDAVRRTVFSPAGINGKPVTTINIFEYGFERY